MHDTDIASLRLASQQIDTQHFDDPAALLAHMGALQAQDYASVLLAIGLRVRGATASRIRAAFDTHTIVRSWLLRGTLHAVPAADLRWMQALLGQRNVAGVAGRFQRLGLDDRLIAKAYKLAARALGGSAPRTRAHLFDIFKSNGIDTAENRGNQILWRLAHDGLLCCAGFDGAETTFALLDDVVPAGDSLPRDEALARLGQRYFNSHGPASAADFAWWAGLTLADAKRACAAADGLAEDDGLWLAAGASSTKPATSIHLLPGFDEYLLGYKDRGAVLADHHARHLVPGGNGIYKPMLLVNGQIRGTWQRANGEIGTAPFEPLARGTSRAMATAVKQVKAFWAA